MVKTYRKIQQWDEWLTRFPGEKVLEAEQRFLPHLLNHFYGKHVVLIGSPHQENILQASVISNKVLLSPIPNLKRHRTANIESSLHELPIASGSVDLVILPHILEYLDNPHQLLSEACRIVRPEGHIVICGFNLYSTWGLKKLLHHPKNIPWTGNFMKTSLIKKWLSLADFELVKQTTMLFRPPVKHKNTFHRLKFLESIGRKCLAPFGGVYVLIAQAKVVPLTPIKLSWKQKLSEVPLAAIGIPRPTTRNRN